MLWTMPAFNDMPICAGDKNEWRAVSLCLVWSIMTSKAAVDQLIFYINFSVAFFDNP